MLQIRPMGNEWMRWQKTRGQAVSELVCFFFFFAGGRRRASGPDCLPLCDSSPLTLSSEPYSALGVRARSPCTCAHISWISFFCFFVVVELHSYTHIQGTWQATETAQRPSRRHRGGVPSHSLSSVPPQQYAFRRHRWHSAHYRLYMSSYVILANECIIFLSAPHTWWSHQCPQSTCDLNEHKYMHCIVSTSSGNYMHVQP